LHIRSVTILVQVVLLCSHPIRLGLCLPAGMHCAQFTQLPHFQCMHIVL
jgi:hypothetical protein